MGADPVLHAHRSGSTSAMDPVGALRQRHHLRRIRLVECRYGVPPDAAHLAHRLLRRRWRVVVGDCEPEHVDARSRRQRRQLAIAREGVESLPCETGPPDLHRDRAGRCLGTLGNQQWVSSGFDCREGASSGGRRALREEASGHGKPVGLGTGRPIPPLSPIFDMGCPAPTLLQSRLASEPSRLGHGRSSSGPRTAAPPTLTLP